MTKKSKRETEERDPVDDVVGACVAEIEELEPDQRDAALDRIAEYFGKGVV